MQYHAYELAHSMIAPARLMVLATISSRTGTVMPCIRVSVSPNSGFP